MQRKNRVKSGFSQRSRMDILACLLKNSRDSSRKTRLIYRCNLSLSQFKKYESCLLEIGLLEKNQSEGRIVYYKTTEQGRITFVLEKRGDKWFLVQGHHSAP